MLRSAPAAIQLVVSDVVMPRLSGRQLYEAIRQEQIPVKFLFTSGYTALDAREGASLDASVPFVAKPWVVSDFLHRVRAALDEQRTSGGEKG